MRPTEKMHKSLAKVRLIVPPPADSAAIIALTSRREMRTKRRSNMFQTMSPLQKKYSAGLFLEISK